mmetsp:Transcript_19558/g.28130  ORF Transcript_19558/g.28130 Transcript_19558/m.28130 type:complete len:80 (+) Transcript_19558:62-301(+)
MSGLRRISREHNLEEEANKIIQQSSNIDSIGGGLNKRFDSADFNIAKAAEAKKCSSDTPSAKGTGHNGARMVAFRALSK